MHRSTYNRAIPSSTAVPNTFSHLGLVVPDTVATEKRLREFGVHIVKPVGGLDIPHGGDVSNAFGFDGSTDKEMDDSLIGIAGFGFDKFLLATDPDGNLLEIQPRS